MRAASMVLLVLAVSGGLGATVATLMICNCIQKRGEKINFLLIRILAFRYISRYREMTRRESGSVGTLYYHFVVPINLALVSAIAAIVLSEASR